jgi:sulfatase modifying factor 1
LVRVVLITALLFLGGAPIAPEPTPPASVSQAVRISLPSVVWIPDGRYTRGSTDVDVAYAVSLCQDGVSAAQAQILCHPESFHDETPTQRVYVGAFGLDRTEVTVAAYRRCVRAGRCTPSTISAEDERLSQPQHPVTGVTFGQAVRYCAFVDGRLPTEAEWERAARGSDGRRFPWGDHYNDRLANFGGARASEVLDGYRYAAPVGSYPDGASPYGILDLAGNALEWTADLHASDTYATSSAVNPRGARSGGQRVIRGGSWGWPAFAHRTTHRSLLGEGYSSPDLGFRCAYDRP